MKQKTWIYILIAVLIVLGLIGMKERFDNPPGTSKASISDLQTAKTKLEALIPQIDVSKYPTTVPVGPIMGPDSTPEQIAQRLMNYDKTTLNSNIKLISDSIAIWGKEPPLPPGAPAGMVPGLSTGYLNGLVDYWTKRVNDPKTTTNKPPSPGDYPIAKAAATPVAPPASAVAPQATVTGTTTGGTTASSLGPTSNPNTSGGTNVWGPQGNGKGEAPNNTTSVNPNQVNYPQLLGGMNGKSGTLVPGVGVVAPSKNVQLAQSGQLPTSAGLGSDENSQYLPYSRTPGDQDLVPNPYKGEFSSSSYSVKNEPVPFLTDFSAFMK